MERRAMRRVKEGRKQAEGFVRAEIQNIKQCE